MCRSAAHSRQDAVDRAQEPIDVLGMKIEGGDDVERGAGDEAIGEGLCAPDIGHGNFAKTGMGTSPQERQPTMSVSMPVSRKRGYYPRDVFRSCIPSMAFPSLLQAGFGSEEPRLSPGDPWIIATLRFADRRCSHRRRT